LKFFSEKAPKIEKNTLKNAIVNIIGCQIFFKLSRMFKNIQIIKKIIVNFEKIDKNVKVASGDPP
jgi:mRNA deadenylase 3'-5' endonuclease subunit Ccr4